MADVANRRSRPLPLALAGLALGLAGLVAYFVVVLGAHGRLPRVRNDALPNWIAIGLGLALSVRALTSASSGRRLTAGILLGLNAAVAIGFAVILYVASALPLVRGPVVGQPAPPFALPDQSGSTVQLADFRGKPLLLVFYRGHW